MSKVAAVCGATGKQGGGVVAALQRLGGFTIRALTRNPNSPSSQKLAGAGVEVSSALSGPVQACCAPPEWALPSRHRQPAHKQRHCSRHRPVPRPSPTSLVAPLLKTAAAAGQGGL